MVRLMAAIGRRDRTGGIRTIRGLFTVAAGGGGVCWRVVVSSFPSRPVADAGPQKTGPAGPKREKLRLEVGFKVPAGGLLMRVDSHSRRP